MNRLLIVPVIAVLGVAGCSSSGSTQSSASGSPAAGATTVTVTSTGTTCDLSATTAPAGNVTFAVTNQGSDVTEFYLYQSDGSTIVGEVEDVTPGLTRDLSADVTAGTYIAACKPTSDSEGIRVEFKVA